MYDLTAHENRKVGNVHGPAWAMRYTFEVRGFWMMLGSMFLSGIGVGAAIGVGIIALTKNGN